MKRIILLIFLTAMIGACTSEADNEAEPTTEFQPAPTDTTTSTTPAVDLPEITDQAPETAEPTTMATPDSGDQPTAETESSIDEDAPTETAAATEIQEEPQPSPTAAVSGSYEGTYFRGSESAPITMFDYSDFL